MATKKEKEKQVQAVLSEVKKLVKKYGQESVSAGFTRYITAVRTLKRLRAEAAKAEGEIKKLLGKTKI